MSAENPISVTVNGKAVAAAPGMPVPELLQSLGLNPERVVVEHNGKAMTRRESAQARLSAGDVLEVVRIVAGG